jgi:hypothetical protein
MTFDDLVDRLDGIEAMLQTIIEQTAPKTKTSAATKVSVNGWVPGTKTYNWIESRFPGISRADVESVIKDFRIFWDLRDEKRTITGWDMAFVRNPVAKTALARLSLNSKAKTAHTAENESLISAARALYSDISSGKINATTQLRDRKYDEALAFLVQKGLVAVDHQTYAITLTGKA